MNFIANNYDSSDDEEILTAKLEIENLERLRTSSVLVQASNFFAGESDDDEEELEEEIIEKKSKLPSLLNPFNMSDRGEMKQDSVFQIQFREDEKKASNALERHVKMTANQEAVTEINGKKICWNFRRGRCRFGHNCTFAHDSDIQLMQEQQLEKELKEKKLAEDVTVSSDKKKVKNEEDEDANSQKRDGRKRRPGLSQTLIPGKKVMTQYFKQK